MEQKIFRAPIELKEDGPEGGFRAEFATLNVIDWHVDVTEPGAFQNGQDVIIEPWNHGWTLPAGKGVIMSDDKKAWVDGVFFLDTEAGRENYRTVKNLGPLAEWSYSFDIEESAQGEFDGQQVRFLRKLDVVGVGPVIRGAGIDTQTVMIKQKDQQQGEDEAPSIPSTGSGTEGKGTEVSKSSNPDADLLTEIAVIEIGMIALGGKSNEEI